MSAPESVVRAAMEALGCRRASVPPDVDRVPWCTRHYYEPWTERGCPVVAEFADSVWVAARREALLEAAERIAPPDPCGPGDGLCETCAEVLILRDMAEAPE